MVKLTMPLISRIVLFYSVLLIALCSEEEELSPRIGIIGAGMGGTSAAHFLRQLFGEKTKIDIFEAERVGGRTALISIDGQEYEAGASVIHVSNRYMVEFSQKFNKSSDRITCAGGVFGLYDDSGIVFQTSEWAAITLVKLLWRYGTDLYRIQDWTRNLMIKNFDRIYDFQERGMAFTTVEDMLRAMSEELLNLTHHSFSDVLRDAGISKRFIDELGMAAMRNNYGQTTEVHGFVGAVSMVGAEPGLWSVRGGNRLIAQNLLKESKASLIEAKVKSVILHKDELGSGSVSYEIQFEKTHSTDGEKIASQEYDIVIVAAPVQGTRNNFYFLDFPNEVTPFSQAYHNTIAMFVQGQINLTTFDLTSPGDFPPSLFTISRDLFFNSIGQQTPVDPATDQPDKTLWKVFLNKVPKEEQINKLFESRKDLRLVDWLAYPEYKPKMDLPPFMLYDRLYYVNSIESAASAMEMSVIGAKNVALLAYNQWHGNFEKIDEISLPPPKSENEKSEL